MIDFGKYSVGSRLGTNPALGITNQMGNAALGAVMSSPQAMGGTVGGLIGGPMGALAGALGSRRKKKVNYVVDDTLPAQSVGAAQQVGLSNQGGGKGFSIGSKHVADLASAMGDAMPEALRRRRANIQTSPNIQLENK